jgi:di/tricarboxylate transporter
MNLYHWYLIGIVVTFLIFINCYTDEDKDERDGNMLILMVMVMALFFPLAWIGVGLEALGFLGD